VRALALLLAFAPLLALADGLPIRDGRYAGDVLVFEVTQSQKRVIDHYRTCQLERSNEMNVYTPYVFQLTPDQALIVRKRVGFAPSYFQVFETMRGFNDSGPFWNLALRYAEDKIEVPVNLLLRDEAARQAHSEQGWKRGNPCFPEIGK
jgi:hypothetical protein